MQDLENKVDHIMGSSVLTGALLTISLISTEKGMDPWPARGLATTTFLHALYHYIRLPLTTRARMNSARGASLCAVTGGLIGFGASAWYEGKPEVALAVGPISSLAAYYAHNAYQLATFTKSEQSTGTEE